MIAPCFGGIDVGGTAIKWRIVDETGELVDEGQERTSPHDIAVQAPQIAADVARKHPRLAGIGIICPGVVDEGAGRVVFASNLSLAGVELASLVEDATGVSTRLMHDGRAAGLAEGLMGAGRGASSFIMMPIGTGISVALMLGDSLWAGATFCAGEIGHSPIFPEGEACRCGQRGCLEVYASAKGLARRYRNATGADIGARAIERQLGIDPNATRVWDDAVYALAVSLTQLTLTVDPERIIIGGGLSHAGSNLLSPLRERVRAMLKWRDAPPIVGAELAGDAGSWGAAILGAKAAGSTSYMTWRITGDSR
ncbi:ROK family protein [Schaalia vaccimaxillae]|uniref:ROK family protein n=1 Tax=Schaalia vaccimaxillae TaxID=183916 RepID=UPI0003B415F0|nr:ROK family protein [Schaalia vaccimaxillae]